MAHSSCLDTRDPQDVASIQDGLDGNSTADLPARSLCSDKRQTNLARYSPAIHMHSFNQTVTESGRIEKRIENMNGAAGVGQLHSQVKIFKHRNLFCRPANGFEGAALDDHGTGAAPKVPVFPTVTVWSMQLESDRARAGDARVKPSGSGEWQTLPAI